MLTKMIAPIALALVLGALPAGAGSRQHDRGNGEAVKLAHRLERAAEELYRDAARHARSRGLREWRALQALQLFDHQADRFLEQVVRHGIHHPRTRHGFEQLERAFVTAEARRSGLHGARGLRDEFERVEHLIRGFDRRLADQTDDRRPRRHAAVRPGVRPSLVAFRFFD
jgi:hypothetical protein